MLTVSEIAVTATTWVLTAAGGFFTLRAALRKKKLKAAEINNRVTEQKKQPNIRSMDTLLEQTVNGAPDAILISDREGIIRFWNHGAELMFGHSAAEAVGQSLDLIIPENLRGRHWEGYRRVMASGETKYKTGLLSSPGIRKDGSRVSLEFSMVLLHDAAGSMQGCASIMRDVTERWQKEKGLKERLAACEKQLAE